VSLKLARDKELTLFSQCIVIAIQLGVKQREPSSKFYSLKFHFIKIFLSLSTYPQALKLETVRNLENLTTNICHTKHVGLMIKILKSQVSLDNVPS
jgi:hypothetical protein